MGLMEETRDKEVEEYTEALGSIKQGETSFLDHPASKPMLTGFAEGFGRGFKAGSGASHAGLSTIIGNIDNGMYDFEETKQAMIALRNAIKHGAGL